MSPRATRTPAPELLDERETAQYIRMSLAYLRAARSRGDIGGRTPGPPFLRLGRSVSYRRDDLDSWLAACRVRQGINSQQQTAA